MAKQHYMPVAESGKKDWLNHFADCLLDDTKGYATKYGVSAANVTALDHGRQWVNFTLPQLSSLRDTSQSCTAFKDALFTGSGVLTPPAIPVLTPPAVPALGGVFVLAAAVVQQIKNHPAYSAQDGEDMGIEGPAATPAAAGADQPDLSKSRLTSGGHPELKWIRGAHTATRILVNRGDGKGEVLLTISTLSHYTDMVLPAAGATAVHTYRAIYLDGDEEFGQWSQPFEITVRG